MRTPTDRAAPVTSAFVEGEHSDDLKKKTTTGIGWAGLSRVGIQVVQFGSTVVLARLLLPAEFGLAAIITALIAFANLFSDLGLGAALIHRQGRLDERFLATAFWLNTISGLALTGLFCAVSVPLANFFGHQELVPLIIVGSLVFGLSMYTVHLALLEKVMRYRAVAIIEFTAAIVSFTVAVVAAVLGAGAMSLVLGSLAQAVCTTIAMWLTVRWRPRHLMDRKSLAQIWGYSGHLFGFNVVAYWSRNLDDLLIGRFGSAAALGFYSRAYMLMLLPVQQVVMVIGRVLFPALSRLQHDHDRLREAYLRAQALMLLIAAPISLGLAAAAGPFIDVAYGARWHPAAELLTILALSGPAQLLAGISSPLYQALGATRMMFRRGMFNAVVTVIAIVVGLHWGTTGVAVALLVKYYALFPPTVAASWRQIGLSLTDGLRSVVAPVGAAVAMALVMAGIGLVWSSASALPLLLIEVAAGLTVYVGGIRIADPRLLREFADIAVPKRFRPGHRVQPAGV